MQEMEKVINYSNKNTKLKIWLTIIFLSLVVGSYFYFSKKDQKESYTYVTKNLKKGDLTLKVSVTGYIQPLETVEVGSEVSGTITKIYVDYNDVVKKGEILAQLNTIKYKSALSKAVENLNAAKANLQNSTALLYQSNATYQRNKRLKRETKNALPSQNDWDRDYANYLVAKAQVASAEAQVGQSKQALISAKYDLDKTTIISPINGTILSKNIDEGQTVAASFQTPVLFKIAKDLKQMQLQASVDEADVGNVKANQKASFKVDAYEDRVFNTKIKMIRVNSEIIEGVVTYIAQMNVENDDLALRPGMSADADISTKEIHNSFIVPKAALLFIPVKDHTVKMFSHKKEKIQIDPKPHIYILKENVPKKVYITVLGDSGFLTAIESKELIEGDKVITIQKIKK